MTKLITARDAARRLGISVPTIHKRITEVRVPLHKLGNNHVFDESYMEKLQNIPDRRGLSRPLAIKNKKAHLQNLEKSQSKLQTLFQTLATCENLLNLQVQQLRAEIQQLEGGGPVVQ